MIDWGAGRYERTAEGLMPAARRVVEIAEPAHGQDVLDLACGTGERGPPRRRGRRARHWDRPGAAPG